MALVTIPAALDDIRADLAALTARIRARTKANALGTNLARGQIEEFLGVGSGDVYSKDADGRPAPAAYAEPENLDDLPDDDAAGSASTTKRGPAIQRRSDA